MGFSLVASAAILAVTLFMAVELISGALLPTIERLNTSYGEMKNRLEDQLQTDVKITSVTRSTNGSTYDFNITVDNTGSVTLSPGKFAVLVNGTVYATLCSRSYLYPGDRAYFSVYNVSGAGVKRIKIITNNGIADYYVYTP